MKKVIVILIFFLFFGQTGVCFAEQTDDYDFSDIQKELEKTLRNDKISFEDLVESFAKGDFSELKKDIKQMAENSIKGELKNQKNVMVELILLGILTAVFLNFSDIFSQGHISTTGGYIAYMMMYSVILVSFENVISIADTAVQHMFSFLKALIPAYSVAVSFSGHIKTSVCFYQMILIGIAASQIVILEYVIPVIRLYLMTDMLNGLWIQRKLSKMADLLKQITVWMLKGLTGCFIGANIIQSLVVPAADSVKGSLVQKGLGAIPGIGGSMQAVTSTFLGSGVLIKNSIGAAGLVVIVLIMIVPCIKILLYILSYQITVVILQPMSEKKMVDGIYSAANAGKLLFDALLTSMALFLLSIAISMASTS